MNGEARATRRWCRAVRARCGDTWSIEMAATGRRLLITDPTDPTAPVRAAHRFGAYCAGHRVSIDDAAALVAVHVASLRRRDQPLWDDSRIALAVGAGWAQHRLDEPVVVTPEDLVDFL